MGSKARSTLAIVGLVGSIFAFAPREPERNLPEMTPVVSVADGPGSLVVDLVDGSSSEDLETIEALLGADLAWTHELSVDEALAEGVVADLDDAVARIAGHPLVEVVEPQMEMAHFGFPDDPMFEKQWHMRAMGAPEGWAQSARGDGVVVAVIDTGVTKVEDLETTEILAGRSFVPGTKNAEDDHGHGTHVAGTIAQSTNNGKGVTGVAPDATILPVKVLSKWGFGNSSWIAAGIDYAVDEGADVINLSLGGTYSAVIHNAVKKARKKGVVVVAAAGNTGKKGVGYPGALSESIGVSATGPDGKLAFYSSWGKGVDLAAPGGDKRVVGGGVLQNTVDGKGGEVYAEFQGTSMAAPHVAGAAAILLSQGMPSDAVERMLLGSARTEQDVERYGSGHLDLAAAMGKTETQHSGTRFLLGGLIAFLAAQLARTRVGFQISSAGVASVVAGGLFFLPALGCPQTFPLVLLQHGLLEWPVFVLGPDWMHFPLWLSAALPLMLGFTLGAVRATRWLAFGLSAGVAAHLFFGVATGTLEPWWLSQTLGAAWLAVNATVCLLLALGLAGTEKLDSAGGER